MSRISYLGEHGESWNPAVGCSPVSEACTNCWARTLHNQRHRAWALGPWEDVPAQYHQLFNKIQLFPDRLDAPLRWRKPRTVATGFMGDMWHPDVPDEFIDRVFATMALTPQHTYLLLTKRPERMRGYLDLLRLDDRDYMAERIHEAMRSFDLWPNISEQGFATTGVWPLPNVWLGVTAENQARADERIPLLLDTPGNHWLSAEPLLGAMDLGDWLHIGRCRSVGPRPDKFRCGDRARHSGEHTALIETGAPWFGHPALDWVVVGGESGPGYREMDLQWAKGVVQQCDAAGVPYYFKQIAAKSSGQPSGTVLDLRKELPWQR